MSTRANRTPRASPETLAGQLLAAAAACRRVREGRSLPDSLTRSLEGFDAAARGAVQDIAYRTMRRRGAAEALLALLADRAPAAGVRELVVVALALALDRDRPYADHVLVDQAVEAAHSQRDLAGAAGFVNALLRRALARRDEGLPELADDEVARFDHPQWWIDRLRRDHPDDWQRVLESAAAPPVLTLRVNQRRASVDAVVARFVDAGLVPRRLDGFDQAIVLDRAPPVPQLPGFAEGLWSVQDAAAQLAAPLLDARDGDRVLDACAAPGGKSAHLLERADIDLLAIDRDAKRLVRVDENLARLGLAATTRAADAADASTFWDGRRFDRILSDVPCTASGIVRRHPDGRWLRRPGDVAQLATAAGAMLDALWPTLKAGGTMVLATCSVFDEEGPAQVARFLARHPDARLDDGARLDQAAGHGIGSGWVLPVSSRDGADDALDHDGFYYARLAKSPG